MCEQAPEEVVGERRQPELPSIGAIEEEVGIPLVGDREVHVHAAASPIAHRFRHERADDAALTRDLARRHPEEDHPVGGGERVCVGEVDLELAVRVLVVDLVDVEAGGLERGDELLDECARPRQPLVVVAGLVERIGHVRRHGTARGVPHEQHEFRFEARVERPAARREPRDLLLQHVAGIERPRGVLHAAVAHDAREAGLPGHQRERREVADRHIVGAVRLLSEAPHSEACEARPVLEHHVLEVLDGDRFRLRNAVKVDELGQDEADVVLVEEFLCPGDGHRHLTSA